MAQYLTEGDYLIDVSLTGGSGKADVVSPARLHVSGNGDMTAEIEWSSPNYDYMKVTDKEYYPVNKSGNSMFIIDIGELDAEIPVTAETTAMSEPHMIDYTLYFDSQSADRQGIVYSSTVEIIGVAVLAALLCAAVTIKLGYKHVKK